MSGTSAMYSKFKMADRLDGTDKNVWVEFASLATQHKALNLGQVSTGFQYTYYI